MGRVGISSVIYDACRRIIHAVSIRNLCDIEPQIAQSICKLPGQPFLPRAGQTNIQGGYATVTVNSGSAVIVYGSVVDNITNDPTTIPMKSLFLSSLNNRFMGPTFYAERGAR